MELHDILKNFKRIQPDPAYKEKSKRMVLIEQPKTPLKSWRTIATIFETGFAVALSVFFILIITGQFSNNPITNKLPGVSSAQLSVINPEALRAEAQAVDIQIQLAQLSYQESTATIESTPQVAAAIIKKMPSLAAAATSTASASSDATSTPSSTVSIDQALQQLSQ